MIFNQHTRVLPASAQKVGEFLDGFGSPTDAIWPRQGWPRARLEGPLAVGVRGGHGPIRYVCEEYEPGRAVKFRFTGPRGFVGHHHFLVEALAGWSSRGEAQLPSRPTLAGGSSRGEAQLPSRPTLAAEHTRLTHTIQMSASGWAWCKWHLAIRALHDALLEDLFDRASEACGVPAKTPYSPYVRLLKWGMARTRRRAPAAAPAV